MAEKFVDINFHGAAEFANHLKDLSKTGFRFAVMYTLSDLAVKARDEWKSELERQFTLRNRWVQGSVKVQKARLGKLEAMESRVGSLEPFMAQQESGFVQKAGPKGRRMPTPAAAGQSSGTRTKPVRAPNRMASLRLAQGKTRPGMSSAQRMAATLRQAREQGARAAFLDAYPGQRGMYRLTGSGAKGPLKLIWDMSKGATRTAPHPTMHTAVDRTMQSVDRIAEKRLKEQLERRGIKT